MAGGEASELRGLHEKLREQVASSVHDALQKSTTILSNLHRLASYLDVMNSLPSSGERLKSALDQVQTVRSDCASLLQTIYLGEIGLQSLQDVGKGSLQNLLPMISEALNPAPLSAASPVNSSAQDSYYPDGGVSVTTPTTLGKRPSHTAGNDLDSSAKKSTVAVFSCGSCNRKFATNVDSGEMPDQCRNCRERIAPANPPPVLDHFSPAAAPTFDPTGPLTATTVSPTPAKPAVRLSKRGKMNPLICQICGISFFYRRCMLRHLRENHSSLIDVTNLDQYVEIQQVPPDNLAGKEDSTRPSTSLGVAITPERTGHDMAANFAMEQATPSSMGVAGLESIDEELCPHDTGDSLMDSASRAILEQANAILSDPSNGGEPPLPNMATLLGGDGGSSALQPSKASPGETGGGAANFREFKCTICDKCFDRPYRLTRHLEIHDPNRPRIPCSYCNKNFTRKDSLESHIRTVHTPVQPFTCPQENCSRTFSTRSMYLNHLKVHGEAHPYRCLECPESFSHLAELKDHLKKVHPDTEELRCSECFKVAVSTEELVRHKLAEHRFECEICGKIFARIAYLQVHVKVHNGQAKFNCRYCTEGFNSIYSYRQHMRKHPEYRRNVNVYPCHACGMTFRDPSELVAHYQTPEHREKAAAVVTPPGNSAALSIMEGELSVGDLVGNAMGDSDELMHSIVGRRSYEREEAGQEI